jgi:tetratricopeptide (TPR) repeat protein
MHPFIQHRARLFVRTGAALLAALLLCLGLPALADDIKDANKLLKQGEYARAMEKVDQHLATDPKNPQARFLRGLIFNAQGKSDEALVTFRSLTEDYPELPEPYNNLAVLYAGQGKYDEALSALRMAIRINPAYATAQENLGDVYSQMAGLAYERAATLKSAQRKLALNRELLAIGQPAPAATAVNPPAEPTDKPAEAAP